MESTNDNATDAVDTPAAEASGSRSSTRPSLAADQEVIDVDEFVPREPLHRLSSDDIVYVGGIPTNRRATGRDLPDRNWSRGRRIHQSPQPVGYGEEETHPVPGPSRAVGTSVSALGPGGGVAPGGSRILGLINSLTRPFLVGNSTLSEPPEASTSASASSASGSGAYRRPIGAGTISTRNGGASNAATINDSISISSGDSSEDEDYQPIAGPSNHGGLAPSSRIANVQRRARSNAAHDRDQEEHQRQRHQQQRIAEDFAFAMGIQNGWVDEAAFAAAEADAIHAQLRQQHFEEVLDPHERAWRNRVGEFMEEDPKTLRKGFTRNFELEQVDLLSDDEDEGGSATLGKRKRGKRKAKSLGLTLACSHCSKPLLISATDKIHALKCGHIYHLSCLNKMAAPPTTNASKKQSRAIRKTAPTRMFECDVCKLKVTGEQVNWRQQQKQQQQQKQKSKQVALSAKEEAKGKTKGRAASSASRKRIKLDEGSEDGVGRGASEDENDLSYSAEKESSDVVVAAEWQVRVGGKNGSWPIFV